MVKIEPLTKKQKNIIDIMCKVMYDIRVRRGGGRVHSVDHAKIIFGRTRVHHSTLADCAAILYAMCRIIRDGIKLSESEELHISKTTLSCLSLIEELVAHWNTLLRIYDKQLYDKKEKIDIIRTEEGD